jgi:imidazolonepropionase-like amidohydrolase
VTATYFANVTTFDGVRVRRKQGVLVQDGRIAWVGAHARAPRAARSATERDGPDRTLTPGLVDCHVHLMFDGSADFAKEAAELTPALAAVKAVVNASRHLEAGVTSVRDLGGEGMPDVARAIAAGLVPGPTVVAAGHGLTITGGHGYNVAFGREVDGTDAMRKAVREEIRGGATAIKLVATGGVLTPGIGATFSAFTPEELEAAVEEAHKRGFPVAAHAIGADGILAAVRAGVDSIEHANQTTAEIVREMKERGTFRSPTICAVRGIAEHPDDVPVYAVEKMTALLADSEASHRRAVRAGVRHVCGTDAGTPFNPHGNAPMELTLMVEWGSKPIDAMRAATANGAELLRLSDRGTVEVGKRADLVVYDANPCEDITAAMKPSLVMQAGVVVAGG